ncbi:hypothetical protein KKA13_01660 [Patescibacteria group bacterium]|nr:hypothetical protein [Patescibacteria group bacterium]
MYYITKNRPDECLAGDNKRSVLHLILNKKSPDKGDFLFYVCIQTLVPVLNVSGAR